MSPLPHPVIAIDGTAASGKSTFARQLAARLGYIYVNTGAMYRGVTWYLLDRKIDLADAARVTETVKAAGVENRLVDGEFLFLIGGIDPLPFVREGRVNESVSIVAQMAGVRDLLVAEQKGLVTQAPLVMEGRDIGTVVFPETPYKFFLDADIEVRSQRRSRQGENDTIKTRDMIDSQRQNSPLVCAPEALRLDSGSASVEELVAMALTHLASCGMAISAPV